VDQFEPAYDSALAKFHLFHFESLYGLVSRGQISYDLFTYSSFQHVRSVSIHLPDLKVYILAASIRDILPDVHYFRKSVPDRFKLFLSYSPLHHIQTSSARHTDSVLALEVWLTLV